jgi:hypothetical protein
MKALVYSQAMQERSRIQDDPMDGDPKTRQKSMTMPVLPEPSHIDRLDDSRTRLEHAGEEGSTRPGASEPIIKNPAAVALGRLGGKKGGKVRAARMTADERSEAARRAAIARWTHRDAK